MNAPNKALRAERMTAEEYLAWEQDQPSGRFELVDGEVVAMASEKAIHVRVKIEATIALRNAVRARGLGCEVFGDGMAIRVSDYAIYEPDVQVRCGPRLPDDALLVPDPLIVVEVLSPSTKAVDTGKKLTGYFSLPSLRHYLVLDPEERTIIHYQRDGEDDPLGMHILHALRPDAEGEGPAGDRGPELVLDPPGLTIRCGDLFEAP